MHPLHLGGGVEREIFSALPRHGICYHALPVVIVDLGRSDHSSQYCHLSLPEMARALLFLALGLLSSVVMGQQFGCMSGIRQALSPFYFAGGQVFDYYQNLCTNELRVTSIYAAAKVYCTEQEIEVGALTLQDNCLLWGGVEAIPYSEIEPKLTEEYIASLPTLTYEDREVEILLSEVYLIDEEYYRIALRAAVSHRHAFEVRVGTISEEL